MDPAQLPEWLAASSNEHNKQPGLLHWCMEAVLLPVPVQQVHELPVPVPVPA